MKENVLGFVLLTIVLQPVEVLANTFWSFFLVSNFCSHFFGRKKNLLIGCVIIHFVITEIATNIIDLALKLCVYKYYLSVNFLPSLMSINVHLIY